MEILKIIGIGTHEWIKSFVQRRPFDTELFWNRCIRMNIIYAKFFQSIAAKHNLHTAVHTIPYTVDELTYPVDIEVSDIIGSGLISIVFEVIFENIFAVFEVVTYFFPLSRIFIACLCESDI